MKQGVYRYSPSETKNGAPNRGAPFQKKILTYFTAKAATRT
jgi:hypothetical protein